MRLLGVFLEAVTDDLLDLRLRMGACDVHSRNSSSPSWPWDSIWRRTMPW
jgi:hypothetical protein